MVVNRESISQVKSLLCEHKVVSGGWPPGGGHSLGQTRIPPERAAPRPSKEAAGRFRLAGPERPGHCAQGRGMFGRKVTLGDL